MTINEADSVALRATVTLTYIPVMNPGPYNMFPGTPETIPGHIGLFPGPFLKEMNQSRERFEYFHQKKSRKWINIPTKCVRRFRKPVLGSRKHVTRHREGLH